jgi:hypothetical protein
MLFESFNAIPTWALAISAFGLQFWLFCLLPHWVNANADVLTPEAYEVNDDEEP